MEHAEESLKEKYYLLEKAQEVAHIGHWVSQPVIIDNDLSGSLIWSDEIYRIFGIDKETTDLKVATFFLLTHPDDRDEVKRNIIDALERNTNCDIEHRIVRPDGSIRWIRVIGEINKRKGKPLQLIGVARDITDDKLRETEKTRIMTDLLQRNKDLEQFTYIVSHNLRSSVANIMGIAEIMKIPMLIEEEKVEVLDALSTSVTKLNDVINDLNDVLQVNHEVSEKREYVCFSELLADIKIGIGSRIQKERVIIRADFSQAEGMFTLKSYLYSIFFNLVSNSIKYRRSTIKPVVEIVSQKLKNSIRISFKDNGLGIDLEKRGEQVFGLYKRFHAHVEGKGMGLYMVKTQVEALGGKITVDSKVNQGTEFAIEFETT